MGVAAHCSFTIDMCCEGWIRSVHSSNRNDYNVLRGCGVLANGGLSSHKKLTDRKSPREGLFFST